MPGGLTRVAGEEDSRVIAMQRGGRSKDTWVLAGEPSTRVLAAFDTSRGPARQLERDAALAAAENLFWFGRYGERCDATARLLRVALGHVLENGVARVGGTPPAWTLAQRLGVVESSALHRRALRRAATSDEGASPAPAPALARRLQPARPDVGRSMATLNRLAGDPVFEREPGLPLTLVWLDRAVTTMMTLSGFIVDGMTRGVGWRFVSVGRTSSGWRHCAARSASPRRGPHARARLAARPRRLERHLPLALPRRARVAAGPGHGRARRGQSRARWRSRPSASPTPSAGSRRCTEASPARASAGHARRCSSCGPRDLRRKGESTGGGPRAAAARRLRHLGPDLDEVLLHAVPRSNLSLAA
jgi:transposase-like protein